MKSQQEIWVPREDLGMAGALGWCVSSSWKCKASSGVTPQPHNTNLSLSLVFSQGEAGDIGWPGTAGPRGEKVQSASANPTPGSVAANLFLHVQNCAEKEHFKIELSRPRPFQRTSREQQFLELEQVKG